MKLNGTQPLPSHHSDLLNSINRCVHLFTFAKLMCKKVASHCGLVYTNVHVYGTIFFSFFPFFWGEGLSFFCINFYLDFALDFFIAPPKKKTLRQNKQTNEQLTLKESLQLMLDLGVKSQQHKQRPNKEKSRKMLAHHHQAGPSLREIQLVSRTQEVVGWTDRNKDTGGEGISLQLSPSPFGL